MYESEHRNIKNHHCACVASASLKASTEAHKPLKAKKRRWHLSLIIFSLKISVTAIKKVTSFPSNLESVATLEALKILSSRVFISS